MISQAELMGEIQKSIPDTFWHFRSSIILVWLYNALVGFTLFSTFAQMRGREPDGLRFLTLLPCHARFEGRGPFLRCRSPNPRFLQWWWLDNLRMYCLLKLHRPDRRGSFLTERAQRRGVFFRRPSMEVHLNREIEGDRLGEEARGFRVVFFPDFL